MTEQVPTQKVISELFEYLPHRYPFLLIDRVTNLVVGEYVEGYKNITMNEDLFNGHFPGQPIFPGVLMLEAMAQLSGVLAFETINKRPADGVVYLFGGVEKARFRRQVIPGDKLEMRCAIAAQRKVMMKFDCEAYVDGELACSGLLTVVEQSNS